MSRRFPLTIAMLMTVLTVAVAGTAISADAFVSAESVQEEVSQKTLAFMQRVIDAQAASR